MSGKGSNPRPFSVDQKTFSSNWDRIFNKKLHDASDTEESCTTRDISDSEKNWYLTAINPWYKIYYNPIKKENKKVQLKNND